jgi:hypothetical protein
VDEGWGRFSDWFAPAGTSPARTLYGSASRLVQGTGGASPLSRPPALVVVACGRAQSRPTTLFTEWLPVE